MKKIISVFSLFLVLTVLLCSCGKKVAVDAQSMKSHAEAHGYTVDDVTQVFATSDKCEKVYKLIAENNNYYILYYQFTSNGAAMNEYLYLSGSYPQAKETSGNNFDKIVTQNAGSYTTVVRVDNTVISATIPTLYLDDALEVLTQLGY